MFPDLGFTNGIFNNLDLTIGFIIWLLSSYFCLFKPDSSFGKKVIFCSWIVGPCRIIFNLAAKSQIPVLGGLTGISLGGTIIAIILAYIYGYRIMEKLNPNASRMKYIVIGFISSIVFSILFQ